MTQGLLFGNLQYLVFGDLQFGIGIDGNDDKQLLAPVVKALDLVAEKSCGSQGISHHNLVTR